MRFLRQSTAVAPIVGPFLGTDGLTPNTGLADQSANARLVKSGTGAAFAAASWAHDALGHYLVGLSTAHTDTLGRLRLAFSLPATYAPVWEDFTVLSAAVYDSLFGATALSTYAGGDTSGTTSLLGRLTAPRAGNLDNLDAAVTSRSTYAGADTSGTGTLLARLTATRAGYLDLLAGLIALDSGAVAAGTSATVFTSTSGGLNATSGAYNRPDAHLHDRGEQGRTPHDLDAHAVNGDAHVHPLGRPDRDALGGGRLRDRLTGSSPTPTRTTLS
jgi:hypothetical protein